MALAYDNNGNTTRDDQGRILKYDGWNHLTEIWASGTLLKRYSYDGLGHRITEQAADGKLTELYYSDQWQVIEQSGNGGAATPSARYVWSPGYVDALVLRDRDASGNGVYESGERSYVMQDANFNVTGLVTRSSLPGDANSDNTVDATGSAAINTHWQQTNLTGGDAVGDFNHDGTVDAFDLNIFAANWARVGPANPDWAVSLRFVNDAYGTFASVSSAWTLGVNYLGFEQHHQGLRLDAQAGLYDGRHRVYSATLMRWLQQDPQGYVDGMSVYAAYRSSPFAFRDALGLSSDASKAGTFTEPDWNKILAPMSIETPLSELQASMEEAYNRADENTRSGNVEGNHHWYNVFNEYERVIMEKPSHFILARAAFENQETLSQRAASVIFKHRFIYRIDTKKDMSIEANETAMDVHPVQVVDLYRTKLVINTPSGPRRSTQASDNDIQWAMGKVPGYNEENYRTFANNCTHDANRRAIAGGLAYIPAAPGPGANKILGAPTLGVDFLGGDTYDPGPVHANQIPWDSSSRR